MRDTYGKMIYALMDSRFSDITKTLGLSLVTPIQTVSSFITQKDGTDTTLYDAVPEEYRYLLADCLYENRTGSWQLYDDEDTNAWECSKCGGVWLLNEGSPTGNRMKYCPYCGAEMRGEA